MKTQTIRHVLIVGSGTMGQQIGLQCARYGCDVTLYDIVPERLKSAITRQKETLAGFVAEGQLTQEHSEAILVRITATIDPQEAAAEVDLLSESVPEHPSIKSEVFAQFHELCPQRTLFTTNTSTLIPSMFAQATGRPAQFAALHFHNPVWVSNVVDIMPHAGTSDETISVLHAFAKRIGQIPIVCHRESYGYVFNAMLMPLLTAALTLAANGASSVMDIDRAWMGVMKTPIGPFGLLDSIGLDTAWDITEYWAKQLGDPQGRKNADYLRRYVQNGLLGIKSGQGFYTYPDPQYRQPGFVTGGEL